MEPRNPQAVSSELVKAALQAMNYQPLAGTCKTCRWLRSASFGLGQTQLRAPACLRNAFEIPLKTLDGRCDCHEPLAPLPTPLSPAAVEPTVPAETISPVDTTPKVATADP